MGGGNAMYTEERKQEAIGRDFHKVKTRGLQNLVDCWKVDNDHWEIANDGEFIEVFMPNGTVMRKKVHTRVIETRNQLYKCAFLQFKVNGLNLKRNLVGFYVRKPVVLVAEVAA